MFFLQKLAITEVFRLS